MDWERDPIKQSRASSLLDKPTGKDTTRRNWGGASTRKDGRWTNPAASGAALSASPVVNSGTVTCVHWPVASLKNEDPTDVCPTKIMVLITSAAATLPMTPLTAMPVCDFEGFPAAIRTGALRKNTRTLVSQPRLSTGTPESLKFQIWKPTQIGVKTKQTPTGDSTTLVPSHTSNSQFRYASSKRSARTVYWSTSVARLRIELILDMALRVIIPFDCETRNQPRKSAEDTVRLCRSFKGNKEVLCNEYIGGIQDLLERYEPSTPWLWAELPDHLSGAMAHLDQEQRTVGVFGERLKPKQRLEEESTGT
ncbi:hypothetical protein EDB87DRAFT_1819125 [Lactarius vividus]|nr:hypothetical protein EDB87DRAFT_1819125 [Lactarius vividus]